MAAGAGEFDDYIASPKGNHYQSLHTAVVGPHGKTLEVQIRTHDMHATPSSASPRTGATRKAAAAMQDFERKIAWMRQLLESKDDRDDDAALLAGFNTEVIEDRVYLLTPQGQVIDLPRGATVLDFAYTVHTDVGHRCRGAKVNGRIVPLTFQPASGDRIEILTGKTIEPRRDWLSPHHGFLDHASRAQKVRTWFKRIDHDANVAAGRAMLESELKRLALHNVELDTLPPIFAEESRRFARRARARRHHAGPGRARAARSAGAAIASAGRTASPRPPRRGKDAIVIEGVGNLLTSSRAAASRCRAMRSSATSRAARACPSIAPIAQLRAPARARRQPRHRSGVGRSASRPTKSTSSCAATTASGCTRTSPTSSPPPTRT